MYSFWKGEERNTYTNNLNMVCLEVEMIADKTTLSFIFY